MVTLRRPIYPIVKRLSLIKCSTLLIRLVAHSFYIRLFIMNQLLEMAIRSQFMPNEDLYRKMCRDSLTLFLNADFMSINPMNQVDDILMEELRLRSMDSFVDNPDSNFIECSKTFCRTLLYNENKQFSFKKVSSCKDVEIVYDSILLTPEFGSSQIFVNHSQFIYPDCVYNGESGVPPQNKVCTIDSLKINPKEYFKNEPIKLLECYRFNTFFQDYEVTKVCRRFINITNLNNEQVCDILRKEILRAQAFTLNYILKFPTITTMPYFKNGSISQLNRETWTEEFNKSLRLLFQEKMKNIKTIIASYGLSYEKV